MSKDSTQEKIIIRFSDMLLYVYDGNHETPKWIKVPDSYYPKIPRRPGVYVFNSPTEIMKLNVVDGTADITLL